MAKITVEKPDDKWLEEKGVRSWPIWEKEVSTFPWFYNSTEKCFILEGRVRVEPDDGGEAVEFGPGDFVTFEEGLGCTWKISKPVRKHYTFE